MRLPIQFLFLLLASLQIHAQGILNGSFEIFGQPGDFLPGWTYADVGINSNWANTPDGHAYANIGTISQRVRTIPGRFYSLKFYAAADLYVNSVATIQVSWAGANLPLFSTQPHAYNENVNRYEQIVWEGFTTQVNATSDYTDLSITTVQNSMILIDDVRLTPSPVPEPSTVILSALGALVVAKTSHRRRPAKDIQ